MAVTDIKETYQRTAETNEKFQRSYTRTFRVLTDDKDTGPAIVREAVPIAVGDSYLTNTEYDDYSYCLSKNAQCVSEDGKQWVVTLQYGPAPDASDPENVENPLLLPPEVSWSFSQFERPIEVTVYGEPIVNTVGDPFSTAIMRDDSRPILSITRNEATFNAALAYSLRDCVNAGPFMGARKGTVKVSNISGQRVLHNIIGFYWKVSYEFAFDANGWEKEILNAGLREKDRQTGQIKNILSQGVPITEPVMLDNFGQKAPQGAPPHIRRFKTYHEVPFGVFNFNL